MCGWLCRARLWRNRPGGRRDGTPRSACRALTHCPCPYLFDHGALVRGVYCRGLGHSWLGKQGAGRSLWSGIGSDGQSVRAQSAARWRHLVLGSRDRAVRASEVGLHQQHALMWHASCPGSLIVRARRRRGPPSGSDRNRRQCTRNRMHHHPSWRRPLACEEMLAAASHASGVEEAHPRQ
eukprot:scaffold130224_cov32-Tisochrysis_lutea.AAC.3